MLCSSSQREQLVDGFGILTFAVVEQHVAAEVRIAAEDFVGAFAGDDDLVAGVADGAAEEIFRHTVGVDADGLGLGDGVGEVVGEVALDDGDGVELGAGKGGHLAGDGAFVVGRVFKGEGEGLDGIGMVARGEAEDGAGVEAAAEIDADGHVGAQADAHGFFEGVAEFGDVVGVRARGDGLVAAGIVEVPVLVELDVLAGDQHVVAGRDLHDAVVEGAHLVAAEGHGVIDAFLIPARGNAGGEERFDFGGEVERVVVPGVEERLDAEAVARGEEAAAVFVPEDEGELAAQMLKAVDAEFLIEVEGDFAVGFGARGGGRAVAVRWRMGS